MKYFTPYEATRTLPLVKRIVADILQKGARLKDLAATEELYRTPAVEDELDQLKDELNEHLEELKQIGCSFRSPSFDVGLVDFPAQIDGEEVLLCWKNDEARLEWYHGLNAGFAGRQKIPAELLKAPEESSV